MQIFSIVWATDMSSSFVGSGMSGNGYIFPSLPYFSIDISFLRNRPRPASTERLLEDLDSRAFCSFPSSKPFSLLTTV